MNHSSVVSDVKHVNRLVQILMERDGMPMVDALEILQEARIEFNEGGDPEEILYDYFSLEPDYIFDLLWSC